MADYRAHPPLVLALTSTLHMTTPVPPVMAAMPPAPVATIPAIRITVLAVAFHPAAVVTVPLS